MYDRGMGVVSLRSYNYGGYWLKIQDGRLSAKVIRIKHLAMLLAQNDVWYFEKDEEGVSNLPHTRNTKALFLVPAVLTQLYQLAQQI